MRRSIIFGRTLRKDHISCSDKKFDNNRITIHLLMALCVTCQFDMKLAGSSNGCRVFFYRAKRVVFFEKKMGDGGWFGAGLEDEKILEDDITR